MGDNIFGMDIRRFSVLFIAIIIILAFIASFANLKVPQQNSSSTNRKWRRKFWVLQRPRA